MNLRWSDRRMCSILSFRGKPLGSAEVVLQRTFRDIALKGAWQSERNGRRRRESVAMLAVS